MDKEQEGVEQINEQLAVEYRASPMANKMIGNLFAGFSAPQPRKKKQPSTLLTFFLFEKKPLSSQEHSPATLQPSKYHPGFLPHQKRD